MGMTTKTRRGVVLIWALVTLAVMTTILGSVGAYYSGVSRIAAVYMSQTTARFAGQRAVERATASVQKAVDALNTADDMTGNFSSKALDLKDITNVLKALDGQTTKGDDGSVAVLSVEGEETLAINLESFGKADVIIEADVTLEAQGGGLPTKMKVRQTLTFETKATSALTTNPIFDYVYFANNYGQLNSQRIIANGNVGANEDFTLNGATVNGFVTSAGSVYLGELKKAAIWPRITYMAKVAAQYDNAYTQVRPTDPIIGKDENGETYQTPWVGGYDPVKAINPYGWSEEPPAAVNPPGPEPSVRPQPSLRAEPTWDEATYLKKLGLELVTTYPTKPTWDEATYLKKLGLTLETYPDEPQKEAYEDEPQKTDDEYAYPDAPYRDDGWLIVRVYRWIYKELNGTIHKTDWNTNKNKNKNMWDSLYEADKKTQDNKYTQDHKNWEDACAKIDADYEQDMKDWKDEKKAIDGRNADKKQKAKDQFDNELAQWKKDCADIDTSNAEKRKKARDAYDADHAAWEQERVQYIKDEVAYESEVADHEQWTQNKKNYETYLAQLADYNTRYAKYVAESAAWESELGAGGIIEELTKTSYAESSTTNLIIKEKSALLEWPDSLADKDKLREYCEKYRLSLTNDTPGSLTCENKSNGSQISFSCTGESKRLYVTNGKGWLYDSGDILKTEKVGAVTFTRKVNRVEITTGSLPDNFEPFTDRVSGSVQSAALTAAQTAEKGSVVLFGTSDNPIYLNGPVYIPGDVLIRGLVSGKGTIYAGRNIHIIGDISYMHPPSWPHDSQSLTQDTRYTPAKVRKMNASKDLLSLVAHGNIIVGDYSSTLWTNQISSLNLSGQTYRSITDTDLTVGSANRDYTAEDGGKTVVIGYASDGSPDYSDQNRVSYIDGVFSLVPIRHDRYTYYYMPRVRNRRFYESVFGTDTIAKLKQTELTAETPTWAVPSSIFKLTIYSLFGLDGENHSADGVNYWSVSNEDSGDITEIDAILFANHGIFGVVGGETNKRFTLNGAMIARDERLLASFDQRFASDADARIWLNWDMRIKSDSAEGVRSGVFEDKAEVSGNIGLTVSDWTVSGVGDAE